MPEMKETPQTGFGEFLERAAEELDRLASPLYGDVPQVTGLDPFPEQQEARCPLCDSPLAAHVTTYDVVDARRYISCPVGVDEQMSY